MADAPTPTLNSFNAAADENGQGMGQDRPTDLARPDDLKRHLDGDPSGEAETARLASGHASQNADDETAAETPAATLKQISDPSLGAGAKPGAGPTSGGELKSVAGEAVERATAGLGKPD